MKKYISFIMVAFMLSFISACGRDGAPKPIPYNPEPQSEQQK